MGKTGDIFKGFLLVAIGVIVIYESYIYNLLDIILLAGILILFTGIALLVVVLTGINNDNRKSIYHSTIDSINRQKNHIHEEMVNIDTLQANGNNESIFTNINKQFAKKYEPKEEEYITPEHNPNRNYNENTFEYPENMVITPEYTNNTNNYSSRDNIIEEENPEDKNVLNIKENNENLNSIETIHVEVPPKEIYNDTETYNFTSNYERPVKVTRKPRKKTETPKDEYEAIVPQDRIRTASIITEEDIAREDQKQVTLNPKPKAVPRKSRQIKKEEPQNLERKLPEDGSYVICDQGILSSKEAFELIVKNAKNNVLLEVPNLKDVSIKLLTVISKLNTKLIIQKFSIEETSYILLLTALMERGVDVKVLNTVNTSNLITDDSHALIISKNIEDNMNYGAVYTDSQSIQAIKEDFNNSWNMAHTIEKEIENLKK